MKQSIQKSRRRPSLETVVVGKAPTPERHRASKCLSIIRNYRFKIRHIRCFERFWLFDFHGLPQGRKPAKKGRGFHYRNEHSSPAVLSRQSFNISSEAINYGAHRRAFDEQRHSHRRAREHTEYSLLIFGNVKCRNRVVACCWLTGYRNLDHAIDPIISKARIFVVPGNHIIFVVHIHKLYWCFHVHFPIAPQHPGFILVIFEISKRYLATLRKRTLDCIDVVKNRFV